MNNDGELAGWLQLLGSGLSKNRLSEMLRVATHEDILGASDARLAEQFGLDRRAIDALRRQPNRDEVRRQIDTMARENIRLLPVSDADYPSNLFQMRTPPPGVFVKGNIEAIDSLAVGIVGPRQPTPYGNEVSARLARDFAPTLTVVSGAALGIDSVAHHTVLEAGGRTLAVLGCGIDVNYPAGNERLRARIGAGESGALVSIFPPHTQPLPRHFPERNFVLAGLSLAVVVIEATKKSGALVTARAAGEEGRTVYAVPGDITRRNSEGTNALLRDGASVCTSAADVIAELETTLHHELERLLERRRATPEPSATTNAASPQSAAEAALLREIQHHPISHDDLINRYVPHRISLGELSSALLSLELGGHIRQEPGRIYAPKL